MQRRTFGQFWLSLLAAAGLTPEASAKQGPGFLLVLNGKAQRSVIGIARHVDVDRVARITVSLSPDDGLADYPEIERACVAREALQVVARVGCEVCAGDFKISECSNDQGPSHHAISYVLTGRITEWL